jgi:hypothetical protein
MEMTKTDLDSFSFKKACIDIGGEHSSFNTGEEPGSGTTFHDCKIHDDAQEEGLTRSIQWVDKQHERNPLSNEEGPMDKATIYVVGRGSGTIHNPQSIRTEHPGKQEKIASDATEIAARKKMVIETEEQNSDTLTFEGEV